MRYATLVELRAVAKLYGVTVPSDDDEAGWLLDLATRDVQRALGAEWDVALLDPEQVEALREATVVQAVFRQAQGSHLALGIDDGVAALGGISFSTRTPPRLSPEANELLAGLGLYARSGTVRYEEA